MLIHMNSRVSSAKVEKELNFDSTESILNALQEHLEKIHESMTAAQEKLMKICNQRKKERGRGARKEDQRETRGSFQAGRCTDSARCEGGKGEH